MTLPRLFAILGIMLLLFGGIGKATETDVYGQVRIYDGNCYDGIGLNGVTVLLYTEDHALEFEATTVTDSAFMEQNNLSSPLGIFYFEDVPYSEDYILEVLPPFGVSLTTDPSQGSWWNANPRVIGTQFYRCFLVDLDECCSNTKAMWWWKCQAWKSKCGWNCAAYTYDEYQGFLNDIYDHFDGREYFPIDGVSSKDGEPLTVEDAWATLVQPIWGCSSNKQLKRAKKQLLALLLNVASCRINTWEEISNNDRTVSEAITFAADMITNNGNLLNKAKKSCRKINKGNTVPTGWIPEGYGLIYYGDEVVDLENGIMPTTTTMISNYPNPFNPETTLQFSLSEASEVNLTVYNLQGQVVNVLVSSALDAGQHSVNWNASHLPSGTYIYRLTSSQGQSSGKMVLLK